MEGLGERGKGWLEEVINIALKGLDIYTCDDLGMNVRGSLAVGRQNGRRGHRLCINEGITLYIS